MHFEFSNWLETNDACRIDFCQLSERLLVELEFELTTPGLTVRVAADRATGARQVNGKFRYKRLIRSRTRFLLNDIFE